MNTNFNQHLTNVKKYVLHERSAQDKFEIGIVASKFLLLGSLLALSIKNGDAVFIAKHPRNFLGECFAVGASALLPTVLFAYNRKKADFVSTANAAFTVFLVFFIFHLLMEMSGVNGIEVPKDRQEDKEQQELLSNKTLRGCIAVLFIVGAGIMTSFAKKAFLANNATHIKRYKEQNIKYPKLKVLSQIISSKVFIGETFFFGIVNALPAYLISKDRGIDTHEAIKSSSKICAVYSLLYVFLELGGFFSHAFGELKNSPFKNTSLISPGLPKKNN